MHFITFNIARYLTLSFLCFMNNVIILNKLTLMGLRSNTLLPPPLDQTVGTTRSVHKEVAKEDTHGSVNKIEKSAKGSYEGGDISPSPLIL